MSSERPAKRTRQACEPCRRKKSRCPGDKPICSHCARLRQPCFYASEPERGRGKAVESTSFSQSGSYIAAKDDGTIEDRLRFVEAQLAEVTTSQAFLNRNDSESLNESESPSGHLLRRPSISQYSLSPFKCALPSHDLIIAAGELYLLYCDCQPLPLFHRESFIQTLKSRPPELLLAILVLSGRFSGDETLHDSPGIFLEESRRIVMKKVYEGEVDLSTLQTLCLLSVVDFTNGNTRRASMHSSLSISLAHNAGLASETQHPFPTIVREERRRCFWSLFLLKRLHGADFGILDFIIEENVPWYPESAKAPNNAQADDGRDPGSHESRNAGVVACALQLSEVWFKITRYAKRRGKPSNLPPWSPDSEYATIMAQQMKSETRMPNIHRFKPAQFSKQSTEDLHSHRDYWGPWIFLQILYHTNLCLLNHPLLLSLRLRNSKAPIPEIFLQSTADLISSHSSWITHLIGMLEAKSFKVTDPFLGHCVAIIATIYLQESFVGDSTVRKEKLANFERCLHFVRGFGEWPHIGRLASKLEGLGETLISAYGQAPDRNLLVDLGQFWEILEYCSSSEVLGTARNLLAPSLYAGIRSNTTEIASTSPLPSPTRVDTQDFASGTSGLMTRDVPFIYSDDELAVLEERFFQQRPEVEPEWNDWWSAGNL